jgi:hypothetical protein
MRQQNHDGTAWRRSRPAQWRNRYDGLRQASNSSQLVEIPQDRQMEDKTGKGRIAIRRTVVG